MYSTMEYNSIDSFKVGPNVALRDGRAMVYPDGRRHVGEAYAENKDGNDTVTSNKVGQRLREARGHNGMAVLTTKPVYVHVDTGRLESKTNDTSEGSDKQTVVTQDDGDSVHKINRVDRDHRHKPINDANLWYKDEAQKHADLRRQNVPNYPIPKHSILPPIDNNQNETAKSLDTNRYRNETSKNSTSKTQNETAKYKDRFTRSESHNGELPNQDFNEGEHVKMHSVKPTVNGDLGGKVQPIYMRFPGQRTGQMVFAEMNQQSGKVRIVSRDKEKEMLARLAWLLLDAGTSALKVTFDSIHPPLSLREHLNQPHVKAVLHKLLHQDVLTEKHWKLLYPTKKKHSSSQKFDSRMLVVLLQTICHLCPPYPSGWITEPLPKDRSLSSDIVRLQLLFQEIAKHDAVTGDIYGYFFGQIRDVIVRLGGPPIRMKIARIDTELINLDLQQHYIKTLREIWHPELLKKLDRIQTSRSKTSKGRKKYSDKKGIEEGMSAEDRVILKKTHKLIVDTVLADDVIDRLQQSQVLKFSDRQEILSLSKKSEKMQMLLDKIVDSKLPYALKALLDAMKFKYKKLHEHVSAVRKQTYKEGVVFSVDVTGIAHDALVNNYKTTFSRVYPFPWSESIHCSVRDLFTPLELIDHAGQKLHPSEWLPQQTRGQRILLEGGSGSGKSVLCAWIAYTWATQPMYFKSSYTHLIYVDCYNLTGNFREAIYRDLFPENFRISFQEFWAMVEKNASDVLFLIDGLDQAQNVDFTDLLTGAYLKQSTVIVAVNPDNVSSRGIPHDTKWFNLGFSEANIKRCFKTCVLLSNRDHEQFEKLYHLAGRDTWPLRPHLTNPMLATKAFATYDILRKGTMLKDMTTVCDLLDKYGAAMATSYCRKQKIDIIGFEFPDDVLQAAENLDRFAFMSVLDDVVQFTESQVQEETEGSIALRFGAFSKFTAKSKLKFACEISRDFLAARHIADMVYEDIENTILRNKMIKLPKYRQLMSFLYGQYRKDVDTPILETLFDQLAARNEYCFRGTQLPDPGPVSPVTDDGKTKVPRGVLQDFQTSMQCLAECPERPEVIGMIASSMPQRLIIRNDGMLSMGGILGLSSVLTDEECTITEMELELHQYHHCQLPVFLKLATATGRYRYMRAIKVTWSSLDIMAQFLAGVMENSASVETVNLIEDPTKKIVKSVTAATWAALQSACNHMTVVQKFSFLGSRVTAILYHVLQHIPTTIESIDLTGCLLNLVCAGEISRYLHGNTSIRSLNLSNVKMRSTECVAIFQGMQMCLGIREIILRGALLDRASVVALSEYIKLTHSLEVLDLSHCELNTDMCVRLVAAIRHNRTLTKLVCNHAKITTEGRKVISKTKTKVQPVLVEGLLGIVA